MNFPVSQFYINTARLGETQDSQEFSPSCYDRSFRAFPKCLTTR